MDVVDHNFDSALAILKHLLPTAKFIAFDLEFTGLGENRPCQLDTPEQRYQFARRDAELYPPIQFGLSLFRERQESHMPRSPKNSCTVDSPVVAKKQSHWEAISFNFNLYPRAVYYPAAARYPLMDKKFMLQSSTVQFLVSHGFDFMKNFLNGISWLDADKEASLLEHISKDLHNRRHCDGPLLDLSNKEKELVHTWEKMVNEWLSDISDNEPNDIDNVAFPKIGILPLPKAAREKRLVFNMLQHLFPRIVASIMEAQEGMRLKVELHASVEHAKNKRQKSINEDAMQIVNDSVQFRYVIDAIRSHKVPLLVHNGLIDATKLYANFVAPLPETLAEFKKAFLSTFPHVTDTRVMLDHACAQDRVLGKEVEARGRSIGDTLRALQRIATKRRCCMSVHTNVPTAQIERNRRGAEGVSVVEDSSFLIEEFAENVDFKQDVYGFGRYAMPGQQYEHEAGYDALETGRLYVMLHTLQGNSDIYNNKICLSSCGGFRFIDLEGNGDERNEWFDREAVIISGRWGEGRNNRFRRTLLHITRDTNFNATKSTIVMAGEDLFIALLERKCEGEMVGTKHSREEDEEGGIEKVVENGRDIDVVVRRYGRGVVTEDLGIKRRRRVG